MRFHWFAAPLLIWLLAGPGAARANGGPFVVKYPGGDPAAKGVLARLHPSLRPARETRLKVIKEDLTIGLGSSHLGVARKQLRRMPPIVDVRAAYRIQNPTGKKITVHFGFPILRGIYMSPFSMMPRPDVRVQVDGKWVSSQLISNSAIYGIIRQRARETIEKGIQADLPLAGLVAIIRATSAGLRRGFQDLLEGYLCHHKGWNVRQAALLAEYVTIDVGRQMVWPRDRVTWSYLSDRRIARLQNSNLGPLGAIGEQKATQLFAVLAGRFDARKSATYTALFKAWGGDVRERSVDLVTGRVRPRQLSIALKDAHLKGVRGDPTIYARVSYLNTKARLEPHQFASLRRILKNLPVVFTFSPMNLLHYRVTFPPRSLRTVTVSYRQYAYLDTAKPRSYQLAYVVHPASLWKSFGPINLEVRVPQGVPVRASVALKPGGGPGKTGQRALRATLKTKTGELFVAVDAQAWDTGKPGKPLPSLTLPPRPVMRPGAAMKAATSRRPTPRSAHRNWIQLALWVPLGIVLLAGVGLVVTLRRRKRRE